MKVGENVWIPCEVKPGPFPDERLVRVVSDAGEYVAFVRTRWLRDPAVRKGQTSIVGEIVAVSGPSFTARFPGIAPLGRTYKGSRNGASAMAV